MSRSDWSRVREVFEAAFELDETSQHTFVVESCAGDDALAEEVLRLLAASSDAAGLLEPPDREDLARTLERDLGLVDPTLTRVGAYELGRVVATGGMGVVFEARQESPRRRVALKMMRLGLDSPDAARRFRYEVEILATLRHPGIAQVFEAGVHRTGVGPSARAVPWFAMEFVEDARTLLEYARELELSAPERLSLFVDACAAVQHGHQRGVIHRDLKPDNILVDGAGRPKVIDFGIARSTDADLRLTTMLTQVGQIVGTLQYMSPEQLAGERDVIDTRSDVYALGVVLFELLTGRLPHDLDGRPVHEVARIVHDDPPRRLAEVDPSLAGDLDLIVRTALDRQPDRRYGTAGELAVDIERFLRGDPIAARPPSLGYQLRLFGRRHRLLVVASLIVVGVSIAAAAVSLDAAVAAREERARSHELFRRFVARSLEQTFEFAPRIHRLPGAAPISTDMIARAVEDLESLGRQAGSDRDLRVDIANAYTRLGEVQGLSTSPNIGDVEAAGQSLERALSLARALVRDDPSDPPSQLALARALRLLGQWHQQVGDSAQSRESLEAAVTLADRLYAESPSALEPGLCCGHAHEMLSRTLYALEELDAADAHCRRAGEVFAELRAAHPDDPQIEFRFVTSRNAMVNAFYRRGVRAEQAGDPVAAREWYEKSLQQSRGTIDAIVARYGAEPDRVEARIWLAGGLRWVGSMELLLERLDEAETVLRQALDIYRGFAAADPDDPRWPPVIGDVTTSLGNVARTRAQQAEGVDRQRAHWRVARARYAESLAIWEEVEAAGQLRGPRKAIPSDVRERLATCDSALRTLDDRRE